ncbi:MAG: LPXTG cell wall anchor domain-containing protein [Gemella haemolysans]|uniref:mucin-binding protein n=1 Tax=Gemella haemolysans TaxID=1379 RepID=UPI0029152ED2|nr:LPXTG cell wall anchor domain-containing protein [Gemella haemolysans]MDU4714463.1 LPXTG cell wall anchor domain-containing protein [Gemella haemolysans]
MFKNNKKEKFSLRKYKDGRTDSKLIGATLLVGIGLLASGGTALANVSSNETDTATMVTDTSKVASTAATTFTDDKDKTKTVKVDAVLEKGTAEPTKANSNTGDADGTDTLNVKSEATVNYKLDSDKSLLKSETVAAGTGTVTTPYDKKGLAYDTDGKDYRESTVTQPGTVVTKDTGKKDTVEANGKVYEYAGKSEVEGADKLTYDKTRFNDIEAPVSPEGMHNKLGEIDYTKTTGKVYLVEETADGQYGKFVEANGVTSDEDVVTKWKAGQATAKDFTKANVKLQEGDTVLVLDKDTYAVGEGKSVTKTKKGTISFSAMSSTEITKKNRDPFSTYITDDYTFDDYRANHYFLPGADGIYGTTDDVEKIPSEDPTYALLGFGSGYDGSEVKNLATGDEYSYDYRLNKSQSSLKDILKNYAVANYKALEFLEGKATDATERGKVQEAKARLDTHLKTLEDDIQSGRLELGLIKTGNRAGKFVMHAPIDVNTGYISDASVDKFKKLLAGFPKIIGEVSVTAAKTDTTELQDGRYREIHTTTVYKYSPDDYTPHAYIDVETTKNIKEYTVYTGKPDVDIPLGETEPDKETTVTTLVNKGKVEIAADGTVTVTGDAKVTDEKYIPTETVAENKYIISGDNGTRTRTETTESATFTKKEIITPIRAYKVMGEEKPVVTHYYNLKITKEEAGAATASKQGSVVIKYVTTDGKQLKSETDKDNVTLETKTIVSLYSGETKVDERTDIATVEQNYDTTPKQYPTLVDADTGFTYEYVGLKQGSPAASGKVVEGTTEVVYEYRLVSEEEKTPSKSVATKTGSVDVKHVVINEDGTLKTLKETEVVKNNVPLEYEDTYVTYSKGVKVSERKEKRVVTEKYDTTDKQYPTLKDEATGLVYKYVGQTSDSASVTGDVTEGEKHVIYSYTLDKQEEKTPSKTVETKGSVVVKYVDVDGNEIKDAENVVTDAVVKTTKTYATKSGDVVLSTRDEVTENDVNYNAAEKKVDTINKDGKKYIFRGVYEVSDKYNNVLEETGKVKEGTTTVVYQYDYLIPVDPTKPNEGEQNPPKPEDKIPNDPKGRTYKDLGLLTEVKRNITYVYENGPKAGQEASASVNQNARFTRTAEINSRTGEVVYTTDWTPTQKLAEVVSPKIDKYAVDKEKVEELSVTHESEDSNEVVKYRENPEIVEHDAAKDKKGSVVVKYVDGQGNEIGEAVTVKDNAVVEKAMTKVYADREETTYNPTNEEYSTVASRKDVIEVNGKKYKYSGVYEVSDKFNNTTEETGKVKVGTTTVVYQYDYLIPVDPTKPNEGENTPPKPEDKIPNDPKGRTYKDLGLLTEVKRNITYVYENGPKAGQEASAPVNQNARFTRTAEINSRTGEVVYTTDWTPEQKLPQVVSPEIKDYTVDKAKVDELAVTHESKDSAVVVKYSQNKPNSVRDYAKDKKGTVVVKFVDINENFLADDEVAKNNVIVAEATTTTTGGKEETTYKATGEEYAVTPPETIVVDGVTFKLRRVLPAGDKFHNTVEEKGLVKEGVTTIVYQYVMQITAPTVDKPEFEGGVVPLDPPTVDIPELKIPEESKPQPEPSPAPAPTPEPQPAPKAPEKAVEPVKPVVTAQVKRLANTGSETSNAATLGFGALIAGIALAVRKRQKEK